jgi:hypothetical protein
MILSFTDRVRVVGASAGGSIPNDLVFHKRQALDWHSVGRQFGKEVMPALR